MTYFNVKSLWLITMLKNKTCPYQVSPLQLDWWNSIDEKEREAKPLKNKGQFLDWWCCIYKNC